jgi:hypothetical protein
VRVWTTPQNAPARKPARPPRIRLNSKAARGKGFNRVVDPLARSAQLFSRVRILDAGVEWF